MDITPDDVATEPGVATTSSGSVAHHPIPVVDEDLPDFTPRQRRAQEGNLDEEVHVYEDPFAEARQEEMPVTDEEITGFRGMFSQIRDKVQAKRRVPKSQSPALRDPRAPPPLTTLLAAKSQLPPSDPMDEGEGEQDRVDVDALFASSSEATSDVDPYARIPIGHRQAVKEDKMVREICVALLPKIMGSRAVASRPWLSAETYWQDELDRWGLAPDKRQTKQRLDGGGVVHIWTVKGPLKVHIVFDAAKERIDDQTIRVYRLKTFYFSES
jgi:hypothetical protein